MARRNLGQMRATVLRRVGNSPQCLAPDANAIIQDVHRDIAVNAQWSMRRREALVATVATYSTGTVSVTGGSATVTGAGTAWTAAMAGRSIAISGENSYFYVGTVNVGAQTLPLVDAQGASVTWGGANGSGLTYRIFQHQYVLPSNVAVVMAGVRSFPLRERTRAHFDGKDPQRNSTGEPSEFALVRSNIASGVEQTFIEFWQVPNAVYQMRVPFLIEPPDLVADADIPVCPSEVIEWRAAAEAAWFIFTKTGDARWDKLGTSYWSVYAGNEDTGAPGVLLQALRDDQQRFGLPQTLNDGDTIVGNDILSQRDWDLVG